MAGSPIQPSSRLVIVMQTWIAPIALAGSALRRLIAVAAARWPRARRASICTGRAATTAYSPTTKNALSPIRIGTAAREVQVPGGIVPYERGAPRAGQPIRETKICSKRADDQNVM